MRIFLSILTATLLVAAADAQPGAADRIKNLLLRTHSAAALINLGPAALDPVVAAVRKQDDDALREVATALIHIKDPDPVQSPAASMTAQDKDVRSAASKKLDSVKDSLGDQSPVDRLLVLKKNPLLKQRLLESEQAVSEPVSVQIKILRSGDIRARADAAFQLRKMGPSAQGAILVLIETLYDPKIEEHNTHWGEGVQNITTISPAMEAAETLVMFGNPAVEPLVAVLEDVQSGCPEISRSDTKTNQRSADRGTPYRRFERCGSGYPADGNPGVRRD